MALEEAMNTKTEVAHCTAADVGISITARVPGAEADAEATIAVLDEYFSIFAKPNGNECLNCGERLGGMAAALMGTGFRWGLVHGEGTCGCGWPCRAYHRPKENGEEVFDRALEVILQYHPDGVSRRGKGDE